jgi:uncharacterized membrane protein
MLKQEFLNELRARLSDLPQREVDDRIAFYGEMIDDRIEEGLSEQEAVEGIGSLDEIAKQIIGETPASKKSEDKARTRRRLKGWEIALIIVGFPVWGSLLLVLFAVLLTVFITLWSLVVSFWAVFGVLAGSGLGGVCGGIATVAMGNTLSGVAVVGVSFVCIGLAIFGFLGCVSATKGTALLTKKTVLGIKRCIVGKEMS